jgi:hypothetical protein
VGREAAFSRRMASEFSNQSTLIGEQRAQGRPGAGCTHGPRAEKKHAAEPQVRAGATGLPCAMVLRLIRDLPGDQALLSPSAADRSADLTPALGRQDHTISPYAICCSSDNTPRPSHPAAYVRDDREAPLLWLRDARIIVLICPTWQCPSPCGTLARRATRFCLSSLHRSSSSLNARSLSSLRTH